MIITLSPIRSETPITLDRHADTLTINGTAWDLSDPELDCPWIIAPPVHAEGQWHVTMLLPHGHWAPTETLFPAPLIVTEDGPVTLPPFDVPPEIDDSGDDA